MFLAARFVGDPIEVSAKFEVVEDNNESSYAIHPNQSIEKKFDTIVDELFKEQRHKSNRIHRPKPFLNSKGQIEFYNDPETKALLQIHSTKKTTFKPTQRYGEASSINHTKCTDFRPFLTPTPPLWTDMAFWLTPLKTMWIF